MTAKATANGQVAGPFGDTTLTKVFVGGLACETPADKLREYFEKFGDILEAVVISDKLSGRSKGYGFVTFKEPEAAKNACEDPAPIINGRRANCNLAAQGSRRTKTPPTPPPTAQVNQPGMISFYNVAGKPRLAPIAPAPPAGNFQWCFPAGILPAASPFHHQHPQAASPFYGCYPAYISADYNQKVSWNGGTYYPQQQMYRGATLHVMRGPAANTWMMPMYPQLYCHPHHQPQTLGHPAHMFPSVAAGPFTVSGPTSDPLSHQPTMF